MKHLNKNLTAVAELRRPVGDPADERVVGDRLVRELDQLRVE